MLERPSQQSPENRKADKDALRSLRATLRSLHLAEQAVQRAAQAAERRGASAADRIAGKALRASENASLSAKYSDRRRQLAAIADETAQAAAEQQLAIEESAERAQLALRRLGQAAIARRAASQRIGLAQSGERRHLLARQRHQRVVLAVVLARLRPKPLAPPPVSGAGHLSLRQRRLHLGRHRP